MNNMKNTIELNEEVYAKLKEARTIALQKSNEDYTKKLKVDCKTMCDAYNRFINVSVPISFQNHNSANYDFESNGDKFKMHKNIHPTECISNFREIEDKIAKELSLKISIQLEESKGWFSNDFYFKLKRDAPCRHYGHIEYDY